MRRFHSYGPVDAEEHFCVERGELVEQCVERLLGNPDKGWPLRPRGAGVAITVTSRPGRHASRWLLLF
jgi:hypothetical protein